MSAKIIIGSKDLHSKTRENIFSVIIILFALLFIGRLFFLQVIKGNIYRVESETQAIKQIIVEPFRGNMFDRNGNLIVHNKPSFTITITNNDFRRVNIPLLASILEIDTTQIDEQLSKLNGLSKFIPYKVWKDVDFKKIAQVEEYSDYLPGVDVVVESKRLYDFTAKLAHVLGYNTQISQYQLNRKRYYRPGDVIGQTGIEKSYEDQLRGNKGVKFVAVNKFGVKVSSFDNGKNDIPVSNGFDLYLTIDSKLQEKVEDLLKGYKGSVVAIDPNNGEIIAMASSPDYNPKDFSGNIPAKLYKSLIQNPDAPMYHRAIMSRYAPGSTWKMLMAIAGLNEGLIDENTKITCRGKIKLGFRTFRCHGAHGAISVRTAIKASCNVFFYELALKLGLKNIEKYGKMFGFGSKTHIDLPNEKNGFLPNIKWAKNKFHTENIPSGYLVNFGIGQGEVSVTPLQMAVYTATLANEGTVLMPHIVRAIHNNISNKIEPIDYASRKIPIKKHIFDIVREGMYGVVNKAGGTAQNAKLPGIKVCGKTGTAQNRGRDHSWFICFAPMDNPKIALCVMIENGGFGSAIAAPIARKILSSFFGLDTLYKPKFKQDYNTVDSTKQR